jgi:D-alanyl-D-alanine dipeptidase
MGRAQKAVALLLLAAGARAEAPYAQLEAFIERQMAEKHLSQLGVALIDDRRVVWQRGMEHAVYRSGLVSELVTDIAVTQLVERGELDLDVPVSKYLPDFNKPVTLRQLIAHRSGLTREPPTGHSLVARLNTTELVYPPGAHEKYSDADNAVVGYVIERTQKEPLGKYLKHAVLDPLGMTESSMSAGGSLNSTMGDVAKLVSALFASGRGLLRSDSLAAIWKPRGDGDFGLSFEVLGFSADIRARPEEKLGVVVFTNDERANPVAAHIGHEGMRLLADLRHGKPAPPIEQTAAISIEEARELEGHYGDFDLTVGAGGLYVERLAGGQRLAVRKLGADLITDDLNGYGARITPLPSRQPDRKPDPAPPQHRNLIGEYAWSDDNKLYVLERDGKLTALINGDYYPLAPMASPAYRFPDWGLYDGETLTFSFDATGRVVAAQVGRLAFKRRFLGPESGNIFRIQPRRPLAEIRLEAQSQTPPVETGKSKADLVDLTSLDPKIKLDIRYAGTDNFLSSPLYTSARAFMQRPAAEALARAHHALMRRGYGLLIHDAYRPWYVTKMFWEATPDDKRIFVANPAEGSRHNRGCAVDLTIYDLATGRPIEMVGVYDEMSERSYPDYPGGTSLQRWHRALLRHAMESEGFTVNEVEWWHFDYNDWNRYAIGNVPFERIEKH